MTFLLLPLPAKNLLNCQFNWHLTAIGGYFLGMGIIIIKDHNCNFLSQLKTKVDHVTFYPILYQIFNQKFNSPKLNLLGERYRFNQKLIRFLLKCQLMS